MQIDKLRGKELDQLFLSILSLKDLEECYRFFDDLCTINEIQSLAQTVWKWQECSAKETRITK